MFPFSQSASFFIRFVLKMLWISGIFLFIGLAVGQVDYQDYDYGAIRPDPVNSKSNTECLCVPFYLCSEEKQLNRFGKGIIEARSQREDDEKNPAVCGPFHLCCNSPDTTGGVPVPTNPTQPSRPPRNPHNTRCGARNQQGITGRILSNSRSDTKFGEFPWQAAILKEESPEIFNFLCGGSLIDDKHVLTVAHCVNKFTSGVHRSLVVRLGEWDAQSTSEPLFHENYLVSQIFVHPKYKPDTLFNDIAILRLNTSVAFKSHIDTICLPEAEIDYDWQRCIVTGWGKDAYADGKYSSILRQVTVPIVDHDTCQEQLRQTRLGNFFHLYDGFICAGGEKDVDSCKGDGGGPLVCIHTDNRYRLVGLVSWGVECGKENVPGVYVKIQKYLRWITRITQRQLHEFWPLPE